MSMWHSAAEKRLNIVFREGCARHNLRHKRQFVYYIEINLEKICRCGGIGIRARLRGVWSNPCGFKSRHRHLTF